MDELTPRCPICAMPATYQFHRNSVPVFQCQNDHCTHIFCITANTTDGIRQFDPCYDNRIYSKRNEYLVNYWKRKSFVKANDRILDIGSGYGHIVGSLMSLVNNVQITCVEPSESYHEHLTRLGASVYSILEHVPKEPKFNSALMIEVIEHVRDPLSTLTQARERLKADGRLFLTTPAGDTRRKLANRSILPTYSYIPEHIQFFTEKSLKLCAKKAGFKRISYRYVNEMYPNREYNTLRTKYHIFQNWMIYFRGGCTHLIYFLS